MDSKNLQIFSISLDGATLVKTILSMFKNKSMKLNSLKRSPKVKWEETGKTFQNQK